MHNKVKVNELGFLRPMNKFCNTSTQPTILKLVDILCTTVHYTTSQQLANIQVLRKSIFLFLVAFDVVDEAICAGIMSSCRLVFP